MTPITQILERIARGDDGASESLLPLVYTELRRLAAKNLADERSGKQHDATSLVHEAYMRLAGSGGEHWNSRGHFYGAAAEAMRRILIEDARKRKRPKHGGDRARVSLDDACKVVSTDFDGVLAIDEVLTRFAAVDPAKAHLVKLRYFGGLSLEECAAAMNISLATAKRHWTFARAWLFDALEGEPGND